MQPRIAHDLTERPLHESQRDHSPVSANVGKLSNGRDQSLAVASPYESPFNSTEPTPHPGESTRISRFKRPHILSYRAQFILRGHRKTVTAIRFSPNGNYLASASADGTIKIWNGRTGRHHHTLEGHLAGISTIAWSPDSKLIASGSDDKLIRIWDIGTGKSYPNPLINHSNYVYSIAFSPRGNIIVSGSYDESVCLWDVRAGRVMRSLPAHSDPVGGVDFVRDGTLVVSCGWDGLIRIWDTATGQCLKTLIHENNRPVSYVRFSPNGRYVLAWTLDSTIRLWNYVENRCVKTYQGHHNDKFSLMGCFGTYRAVEDNDSGSASPENDLDHEPYWQGGACAEYAFIASGSEDGSIVLWDVESKDVLQRLNGHEGAVLSVDFHPTEQTLASAGNDGTVRIWSQD